MQDTTSYTPSVTDQLRGNHLSTDNDGNLNPSFETYDCDALDGLLDDTKLINQVSERNLAIHSSVTLNKEHIHSPVVDGEDASVCYMEEKSISTTAQSRYSSDDSFSEFNQTKRLSNLYHAFPVFIIDDEPDIMTWDSLADSTNISIKNIDIFEFDNSRNNTTNRSEMKSDNVTKRECVKNNIFDIIPVTKSIYNVSNSNIYVAESNNIFHKCSKENKEVNVSNESSNLLPRDLHSSTYNNPEYCTLNNRLCSNLPVDTRIFSNINLVSSFPFCNDVNVILSLNNLRENSMYVNNCNTYVLFSSHMNNQLCLPSVNPCTVTSVTFPDALTNYSDPSYDLPSSSQDITSQTIAPQPNMSCNHVRYFLEDYLCRNLFHKYHSPQTCSYIFNTHNTNYCSIKVSDFLMWPVLSDYPSKCQVMPQLGTLDTCLSSDDYGAVRDVHTAPDDGANNILGYVQFIINNHILDYPLIGPLDQLSPLKRQGIIIWTVVLSTSKFNVQLNNENILVNCVYENNMANYQDIDRCRTLSPTPLSSKVLGFNIVGTETTKVKNLLPIFAKETYITNSSKDIRSSVTFRTKSNNSFTKDRGNCNSGICDIQMYRSDEEMMPIDETKSDSEDSRKIKLCGIALGTHACTQDHNPFLSLPRPKTLLVPNQHGGKINPFDLTVRSEDGLINVNTNMVPETKEQINNVDSILCDSLEGIENIENFEVITPDDDEPITHHSAPMIHEAVSSLPPPIIHEPCDDYPPNVHEVAITESSDELEEPLMEYPPAIMHNSPISFHMSSREDRLNNSNVYLHPYPVLHDLNRNSRHSSDTDCSLQASEIFDCDDNGIIESEIDHLEPDEEIIQYSPPTVHEPSESSQKLSQYSVITSPDASFQTPIKQRPSTPYSANKTELLSSNDINHKTNKGDQNASSENSVGKSIVLKVGQISQSITPLNSENLASLGFSKNHNINKFVSNQVVHPSKNALEISSDSTKRKTIDDTSTFSSNKAEVVSRQSENILPYFRPTKVIKMIPQPSISMGNNDDYSTSISRPDKLDVTNSIAYKNVDGNNITNNNVVLYNSVSRRSSSSVDFSPDQNSGVNQNKDESIGSTPVESMNSEDISNSDNSFSEKQRSRDSTPKITTNRKRKSDKPSYMAGYLNSPPYFKVEKSPSRDTRFFPFVDDDNNIPMENNVMLSNNRSEKAKDVNVTEYDKNRPQKASEIEKFSQLEKLSGSESTVILDTNKNVDENMESDIQIDQNMNSSDKSDSIHIIENISQDCDISSQPNNNGYAKNISPTKGYNSDLIGSVDASILDDSLLTPNNVTSSEGKFTSINDKNHSNMNKLGEGLENEGGDKLMETSIKSTPCQIKPMCESGKSTESSFLINTEHLENVIIKDQNDDGEKKALRDPGFEGIVNLDKISNESDVSNVDSIQIEKSPFTVKPLKDGHQISNDIDSAIESISKPKVIHVNKTESLSGRSASADSIIDNEENDRMVKRSDRKSSRSSRSNEGSLDKEQCNLASRHGRSRLKKAIDLENAIIKRQEENFLKNNRQGISRTSPGSVPASGIFEAAAAISRKQETKKLSYTTRFPMDVVCQGRLQMMRQKTAPPGDITPPGIIQHRQLSLDKMDDVQKDRSRQGSLGNIEFRNNNNVRQSRSSSICTMQNIKDLSFYKTNSNISVGSVPTDHFTHRSCDNMENTKDSKNNEQLAIPKTSNENTPITCVHEEPTKVANVDSKISPVLEKDSANNSVPAKQCEKDSSNIINLPPAPKIIPKPLTQLHTYLRSNRNTRTRSLSLDSRILPKDVPKCIPVDQLSSKEFASIYDELRKTDYPKTIKDPLLIKLATNTISSEITNLQTINPIDIVPKIEIKSTILDNNIVPSSENKALRSENKNERILNESETIDELNDLLSNQHAAINYSNNNNKHITNPSVEEPKSNFRVDDELEKLKRLTDNLSPVASTNFVTNNSIDVKRKSPELSFSQLGKEIQEFLNNTIESELPIDSTTDNQSPKSILLANKETHKRDVEENLHCKLLDSINSPKVDSIIDIENKQAIPIIVEPTVENDSEEELSLDISNDSYETALEINPTASISASSLATVIHVTPEPVLGPESNVVIPVEEIEEVYEDASDHVQSNDALDGHINTNKYESKPIIMESNNEAIISSASSESSSSKQEKYTASDGSQNSGLSNGPVARRCAMLLDEEERPGWNALCAVNSPDSDSDNRYASDDDFDIMDAEMRRLEEKLKKFERELGETGDDVTVINSSKNRIKREDLEELRTSPLPPKYPPVDKKKTKHLSLMSKLDVDMYVDSGTESSEDITDCSEESADFIFAKKKIKLKPGDRRCRSINFIKNKKHNFLKNSNENVHKNVGSGNNITEEIVLDEVKQDSANMISEEEINIINSKCTSDELNFIECSPEEPEKPLLPMVGVLWHDDDGMSAVDFDGLDELMSITSGESTLFFIFEDDDDDTDSTISFTSETILNNAHEKLISSAQMVKTNIDDQNENEKGLVSSFKSGFMKAAKYLGPKVKRSNSKCGDSKNSLDQHYNLIVPKPSSTTLQIVPNTSGYSLGHSSSFTQPSNTQKPERSNSYTIPKEDSSLHIPLTSSLLSKTKSTNLNNHSGEHHAVPALCITSDNDQVSFLPDKSRLQLPIPEPIQASQISFASSCSSMNDEYSSYIAALTSQWKADREYSGVTTPPLSFSFETHSNSPKPPTNWPESPMLPPPPPPPPQEWGNPIPYQSRSNALRSLQRHIPSTKQCTNWIEKTLGHKTKRSNSLSVSTAGSRGQQKAKSAPTTPHETTHPSVMPSFAQTAPKPPPRAGAGSHRISER